MGAYLPFALAASQSFFVISEKPLPLQEFCPLQELLAPLQDDWPLQALAPSQCIFASSAEAVVTTAALKASAAAVAMAIPERFFDIDIRFPPIGKNQTTH